MNSLSRYLVYSYDAAYTDRQLHPRIVRHSRLLHHMLYMSQLLRKRIGPNARKYEYKLVTAVTHEYISLSYTLSYYTYKHGECLVTGIVSVRIVAQLKIIHVYERDSCRYAPLPEFVLKIPSVIRAREHIRVKLFIICIKLAFYELTLIRLFIKVLVKIFYKLHDIRLSVYLNIYSCHMIKPGR